jgi:hypothetical protein
VGIYQFITQGSPHHLQPPAGGRSSDHSGHTRSSSSTIAAGNQVHLEVVGAHKWENKLIPPAEATTKLMYSGYKTVFGMNPPEDIEPTTDQFSAIKMLDDVNFTPGVDLLVRTSRPPSYEETHICSSVVRTRNPHLQTLGPAGSPRLRHMAPLLEGLQMYVLAPRHMQSGTARRIQRPHPVS